MESRFAFAAWSRRLTPASTRRLTGLHTRRIRQGHEKPVQEVTDNFGSQPTIAIPMFKGISASVRKVFFCNGPQLPRHGSRRPALHL